MDQKFDAFNNGITFHLWSDHTVFILSSVEGPLGFFYLFGYCE